MAKAETIPFSLFLIELGSGTSPETYAKPCGLTSRSWSSKAQTQDTNVPDCDDEDAPSWLETDIVGYSQDLNGSGVVDIADYPTWEAWVTAGGIKNVRVTLDELQWIVPAVLADLTITGQRGSKVQLSVQLKGSGAPVVVP